MWSLGKLDNSVIFLQLLISLSSPIKKTASHSCCDWAKPFLLFTNLLYTVELDETISTFFQLAYYIVDLDKTMSTFYQLTYSIVDNHNLNKMFWTQTPLCSAKIESKHRFRGPWFKHYRIQSSMKLKYYLRKGN